MTMNLRPACVPLLILFAGVLTQDSIVSAADEAVKKVTFEDDVLPVFRQYCLNCHHQGEKKGGLALDTFGSTMEGGGSGEVVFDDGDAEGSRLWQLVNHDDTPVMPPKADKMPADKLAIIRSWIEGGILENSGSKVKKKAANPLTYTPTGGGKPEGPVAMPESVSLETVTETSRPAAVTAIAASPWAPVVAVAGQNQIVLYHTDTSELLGVIPFPEGVAQDLRFSRDGSYLIAGGGEHSASGFVAIYDVKTGNRVGSVGNEFDVVFGADVNESMSNIALGGPQKMLRIYDIPTGERLFDIKKHTDWIYSVAYSPDGVLVASADRSGGLCVWEAETGRLYLNLIGHKGAIYKLAWRDDSNVLASASADGTVKLWEMNGGKAIRSISAHGGGATSVCFDHQGRLATAGVDNRAKLWAADGKLLKEFTNCTEDALEVALSHDGKRIIFGDWNGAIFNASTDDPKVVVALKSNPPSLQARRDQLKQKLVAAQATAVKAKASVDQLAAASAAASKAVTDIDNAVKAANGVMQQKQVEAQKSQTTVAGLEKSLAALRSQLEAQTKQLEQQKAAIIAQQAAIAKAKADAAKLTAARPAAEATMKDAKGKIGGAKAALDAANASVGSLQKALEMLGK
ncbi:MAG: hypothetical protein CBB71_13530 [Rhodopirellula sp. TMED11]|nr:MAG: hypothetical protein CBB71_13530 [Rhodopirellula sp. TMED11]